MTSIVNSVAYRHGQSLGEIAIDEISGLIQQPDTFVWLGLHEPDEALLLKIQGEFGLHELAIPTVTFSLYGMNFEWMPELKWRAGYPLAVVATLLGCVFVYRRLRRAGWV